MGNRRKHSRPSHGQSQDRRHAGIAARARGTKAGRRVLNHQERSRGGQQQIPRPASSIEGGPAPWAHVPAELRRPTMAQIREVMASAPAPRSQAVAEGELRSAVLAGLYEDVANEGRPHVVLTRRSKRLRSHSGEVSFPGGRQEPGEELWVTALREAEEEIALDRSAVVHLGELDHLRTVSSRSWIVPYVAEITDPHLVIPQLQAAPDEVELVLHVELDELLKDDVFREELWTFGEFTRPVFFFEIEGDTVWGATAAMLRNLLSLITGTHDPRVELSHWDSPDAVLPPDLLA